MVPEYLGRLGFGVLAPPHRYPALCGLALGIHHHSGRLRSYTYILSVYLTRVCLVIIDLRDLVNSVSYSDNDSNGFQADYVGQGYTFHLSVCRHSTLIINIYLVINHLLSFRYRWH